MKGLEHGIYPVRSCVQVVEDANKPDWVDPDISNISPQLSQILRQINEVNNIPESFPYHKRVQFKTFEGAFPHPDYLGKLTVLDPHAGMVCLENGVHSLTGLLLNYLPVNVLTRLRATSGAREMMYLPFATKEGGEYWIQTLVELVTEHTGRIESLVRNCMETVLDTEDHKEEKPKEVSEKKFPVNGFWVPGASLEYLNDYLEEYELRRSTGEY